MRDKYGVNQDNYCYPNSNVLKNKLNIIDDATLEDAELAFTAVRYTEYSSAISSINTFNLTHLKALHQHFFQNIKAKKLQTYTAMPAVSPLDARGLTGVNPKDCHTNPQRQQQYRSLAL
jgi:cell filamentation protein